MEPIGLADNEVKLNGFTQEWLGIFKQEKTRITEALGAYVFDVQHVGSTAVKGMVSKPIIDIAVALRHFRDLEKCIPALRRLGYEHMGENDIRGRHIFKKGHPPRRFHLYCVCQDTVRWENYLLFRDYLKRHKTAAREYSLLKKELAEKFPKDRENYSRGKENFIKAVIRRAREKD